MYHENNSISQQNEEQPHTTRGIKINNDIR